MSLWRTSFSFPSTTPLLKSLIFLLPTLYPLRISAQAGIRISHCQVLRVFSVNQEMGQATISRLSMALHYQYTGEVRLLFSCHPFSAKKKLGTGIQLQGNATNASYSLILDGAAIEPEVVDFSNSILATIQGLPDAEHTISLTTQIPSNQDPPNSSIVVFDRAIIISTITNDTFPECVHPLRACHVPLHAL